MGEPPRIRYPLVSESYNRAGPPLQRGGFVRELYGHPDAAIARKRTRDAFREVALVTGAARAARGVASEPRRHTDTKSPVATGVKDRARKRYFTPCSPSPIRVRDRSHAAPILRADRGMEPSGRGMGIVAALSSGWGVDLAPDGKVVLAELGA